MKLFFGLTAFVFLVYATTLNYPFFFDDSHYIVNNSAIQNPANLLKIWTSASYYSHSPENWGYRPFTTFLHSLAWQLGGGATWPFHVEKKILHAIVCLLLCLVWGRLWAQPGFFPATAPQLRLKWEKRDFTWTATPTAAAIALAVVFAVHPANTQVLNYISASSTLLCGTCYIAAYYFYLRFRESPRAVFLLSSFALYALSVLAKEEGITLVGVIVLTELFLPSRPRKKSAIIGYFVMAALTGLLLKYMFAESSSIARGSLSRWNYFMTQWSGYLHYMKLLVWPVGLNADNLEFGFATTFWDGRVISALLTNLLLVGAAFWYRKRFPVLLFGLLWFYIAISPASSIIPLSEPVNDHRMYIGYFGLIGAIFPYLLLGIDRLTRKKLYTPVSAWSGSISAALFIALLVGTQVRNSAWASQVSLWTDTMEKNPHSPRALNNLAIVHMGRGEWKEALALIERCEVVGPTYSICNVNKAILLATVGRDVEAEQKYRDVIAADPQRPELKTYFAQFLKNHGRLNEAMMLFREADQIAAGTDLEAKIGLASAAIGLGRIAEARTILEAAQQHFGNHPQITALQAQLGTP